jgi:hypothetical protein
MVAGAMNAVLLVGEEMFIRGGELAGADRLLVTVFAEKEAACPPAEVCRGFEEGFV